MRGLLAGRPLEEVLPSLLFFIGAFALGRILHARDRRAADFERRAVELEAARDEETQRAIAEERSRIARELHDVIAHSLSVMVVQASAERRVLSKDQASTRDVLLSIEQAGREALTELRRLLGILRKGGDGPTLEPQPGLGQLDNLIDQVRQAGLDVRVRLEGGAKGLSPGLDLAAYRILQEALTNVLKHAGPCKTEILVRYGPREVELEVINDEGRVRAAPTSTGHGLIGMRERVSLYGGAFEAGPSESDSYRVHAVLPLEPGQE
jgi:signal transduction histidine kinase